MSFNSKAAIAACFATVFIVSSTVSIVQSGGGRVLGMNTAMVR
ncbi:MAG: hypothetical protein V4808_11610 [Pseudomonadota bacterium]